MELLVIAEKSTAEATQQHFVKVLRYISPLADCFSTVHFLSAFDRSKVDTEKTLPNMVIHSLKPWYDVHGLLRVVLHLAYLWQLFWAGRELLKKQPRIKIITHPFGHYLSGLVVVLLARTSRRRALVRITGSSHVGIITLRQRYGNVVATILGGLLLIIEEFVLRQADWIISVSPLFLEHYPQHADKTVIIPVLVPILDQRFGQGKTIDRSEKSTNHGSVNAIFVGRLEAEKGIDIMLKALVGLSGVTCQIVGEGSLRQQLKQQARALGLSDRVTFCGQLPQERVFELMAFADVLLLPSRTEYTPNVLIEAAAQGLPAIATNVGGVKYMIKHGQTGLLCQAGDVDSLREQLIYFSNNMESWSQWGKNARNFVLKTYGTAVIKQQAEGFLRRYCIQDMDA